MTTESTLETSSKVGNKKWAVKRITVNLATQEAERLEKFCQQTGRPATDVIRELIRSLPIESKTENGKANFN